jgi:hypothetical protein
MYYGQVKQHILILVVVKMKRMIYGHKNYIVLVYVIQVILLSSLVYAQERCVYTVYQLVCYSYTHHEMTIHHCETDIVFLLLDRAVSMLQAHTVIYVLSLTSMA